MKTLSKPPLRKILIKKCHICGLVMESYSERQRCTKCKKSFLPSSYYGKVRATNGREFKKLFSPVEHLHSDDLIKGLHVIW